MTIKANVYFQSTKMYFLDNNFTRVHRGINKQNSKNCISKTDAIKIFKKFEAGDHVCLPDVNETKNSVFLTNKESDTEDEVSVSSINSLLLW